MSHNSSTPIPGFGWLCIAMLAFSIAAYAIVQIGVPAMRSPFAGSLVSLRPVPALLHFLGGGLALAIGALQINRKLRMRSVSVHRWLGRLYVLAVILGGTAGLALAVHAFGGAVSIVGFGLLGVLWLSTTLIGYWHIRNKNTLAHRAWMLRSYSLTLAAVTLRIYVPLTEMLAIPFEVAYPAIAWLAWVPNLLVAELFLRARPAVGLNG
jgi:hypothetical protein